jgi:hypothetical protein
MAKSLRPVNVGIDVSKDTLDVHLLERDLSFSVPNDQPSITSLIKRLALDSGSQSLVSRRHTRAHNFIRPARACLKPHACR